MHGRFYGLDLKGNGRHKKKAADVKAKGKKHESTRGLLG